MKKLNKINIFFIICFIAILIAPLIFINRVDQKVSDTENRYLVAFPKIFESTTGNLRSDFFPKFNLWLNDNIGFREEFVKLNTQITYKGLHSEPNNSVRIGLDGWFFYNNDLNIEIGTGNFEITDDFLENIKSQQEKIQMALREKGIDYVLVLTPSKVSVYPDKVKGIKNANNKTLIDIVSDYLEENTNIKVINTKPELIRLKNEGKQVFYKTDTHWNEEGAYYGYRYIISKMNEWYDIKSRTALIKNENEMYKGEFSSMFGLKNLLEAEKFMKTEILYKKALELDNKNLSLETARVFNNDSLKNDYTVLMYGDSFFGSWEIPELFAESFPNLFFIWNDIIKGLTVSEVNPDIVILERTERYLYRLLISADKSLIYGNLESPNAEIISHDTPVVIERGEKYNVNITVKNTSKGKWSNERDVRLCIWQNGQDFGYRINIPDGVEIDPNEEYTFTLVGLQAPPESETYLEYQMVEEGVVYFGEKERVDIKIIE